MRSEKEIIEDLRAAISCCCSPHRYEEVNALLDELEEVVDVDTVRKRSQHGAQNAQSAAKSWRIIDET